LRNRHHITFSKLLLLLISFFIGNLSVNAIDLPKNQWLENSGSTFMKNEGQWNDGTLYLFRSGHFQASFHSDKIVFAIATPKSSSYTLHKPIPGDNAPSDPRVMLQIWEIRYKNASSFQYITGKASESKVGYTRIHKDGIIAYPGQFETLSINNLYDGIDARFSSENGVFKIDYIIKAGIQPNIEFTIDGFENSGVDEKGNIVLESTFGKLIDSIPNSYELNQSRTPVKVKYGQTGNHTYRLQFPDHFNNTNGIVVDPFYLDYSTYFYGSNSINTWTYIYDVNVDNDNNSYVTGITYDKFAGKPGTYDTTLAGASDAYLCKIPSGGGKPDYFVYVGGSLMDYGYAMATKENGDSYLTGYTTSSDFPVTSGVLEPVKPGITAYTSFVTGIKSDGSSLIYSTYLKGYCWVIQVNETGQVYIAPYGDRLYTVTANINPPGQVGGSFEANIIRLNSTGSSILNCVALIGSGVEYVYALSIDKKNQVYAAGWTQQHQFTGNGRQSEFWGSLSGGHLRWIFV
jgi:hypothetical protein